MPPKKPSFHPINEILGRFLKGRRWEGKLKQYSLHASWEEVVGPKIAKHATPTIWRGNTLFVEVSHPAWLQELRMMENEVIEKIQIAFADIKIDQIRWVLK